MKNDGYFLNCTNNNVQLFSRKIFSMTTNTLINLSYSVEKKFSIIFIVCENEQHIQTFNFYLKIFFN